MQARMQQRLSGRSSAQDAEEQHRKYHGDRRSRTVPAYDRQRSDEERPATQRVQSMERMRFGRRSSQDACHRGGGGGGGGGGGAPSGGRAPSDSRVNFSAPTSDFTRSSPAGGGR